jgi:Protein of unknown function (DUF2892)
MNNVGKIDRVVRLILATVIAVLWVLGAVQGWLGIVLAVVAALLLFTALFGTCPLYSLFGITTSPVKKNSKV